MPRDLSDPTYGPHAVQLLLDQILTALPGEVRVLRDHPEVSVDDNYTALGYPPDAITRDARHTRYTGPNRMLRSHTTAMVPPALRLLGTRDDWDDVTLACVGMVYRRDAVDRVHSGTPHQLDVWRISHHRADLDELVDAVVTAAVPGLRYRTTPATHPYTTGGKQVDVLVDGEWLEVAECGLAARHVLRRAWLPDHVHGLALGLGLDRLLMLRKGVPDIRLLSSDDPRVANQMLDLTPYRPVSKHPPVTRDISVAVGPDADDETIGDLVRAAVGDLVEEVAVVGGTPVPDLPPAAVARLGARPDQRNVLVRLVLRHPTRTLTDDEANAARDAAYAAVHEGDAPLRAAG
ncbi:PheS-related mystery ligase SrmL [Actinosynnema sp. NPDC004786]